MNFACETANRQPVFEVTSMKYIAIRVAASVCVAVVLFVLHRLMGSR